MHLYTALWGDGYPFNTLFESESVAIEPSDLTDVNSVLLVWGGEDIDPSLYGHPKSIHTYSGGKRDDLEWKLMKQAVSKGIPIIGICRGAQMLCALAGGYLLQDIHNHAGSGHSIQTSSGEKFYVNSLHHQMMVPLMTDHELLAWSESNLSNGYVYKNDIQWIPPEGWREPELVYFRKIKGLAIQWHPEMMGITHPTQKYLFNIVKEKVCNLVAKPM